MAYLRECVESVLAQTFRDFELVIVDDASTDQSLRLVESYHDPRIRIFRNEKNLGQVASLNKGLQYARGALIARLDQDDVNLPTRLEGQRAFMDAHRDVAIVCSYEHTIDSSGKYVCSWRRTIPNYGSFLAYILLGLCPVWHPSVMFRRDVVLRLGGYDTSFPLAEDFELWSRLALGRYGGAVVPAFHLLQRVHQDRQSERSANTQQQSLIRAHERVLESLLPGQPVVCLAALLRLEGDPCGRSYRREHASSLSSQIHTILNVVRSQKMLTDEESLTLGLKIFSRVGPGVWFAESLARLPENVFRWAFFVLSPVLLARFHSWASAVGRSMRKLYVFYRW